MDKEKSSTSAKTSSNISETRSYLPLDFSFKSILCFSDLTEECEKLTGKGLAKSKDGKWKSDAIRLNNNGLSDCQGLKETFNEIFARPFNIAWLDVSFNDLQRIDKVIGELTNLKVLYLHGNAIYNIFDVNRLTTLTGLISLTLHGNPIETDKGYRQYVLSVLPGLKTLDFSGVTKQDRSTAETWKKMYWRQIRFKRKLSLP